MSTTDPISSTPTSPNLLLGIEQFNRGDYYDCHDTLEAIWMDAPTSDKPFYQGILQIAVGLYHLQNHNWRGAAILLGEGNNRLLPFEPVFERIDVTDLIDQATDWLNALQKAGPEQVALVAKQLATAVDVEVVNTETMNSARLPRIRPATE